MLPVTAFFAAILTFWYLFLSVLVIRARRKAKVAIGDGRNDDLMRAMRVHGNFAEYIPLGLILMALVEAANGAYELLVVAGGALLLGRVLHAYSLLVAEKKQPPKMACRVGGMMMTFTTLGVLAAYSVVLVTL